MRDINSIYNFMLYLVRKERGIFLSPEECTASLDTAQLDKLEDDFKPYGQTQILHDSLRPFRVYYNFTSDSSGAVTFPSDYLHMIGSPQTVYGSTISLVTFMQEDEWVNAVQSQLRPVTLASPIARDTATGFNLFPYSTQSGIFTYLRRPETPVYGFTQVGRVITYDPLTSVQLNWTDAYINNIIARALAYLGLNMSEADLSKFSEIYQQQTQANP